MLTMADSSSEEEEEVVEEVYRSETMNSKHQRQQPLEQEQLQVQKQQHKLEQQQKQQQQLEQKQQYKQEQQQKQQSHPIIETIKKNQNINSIEKSIPKNIIVNSNKRKNEDTKYGIKNLTQQVKKSRS